MKDQKSKISVTIITLNEEKSLRRCLNSVEEFAGEVILIDSGSVDRTVEIAKNFGAKVFVRKFDDMGKQKNYAITKAKYDWIFSIDADEVVTKKLKDEIKKAVRSKEFNGYLIPRRNIILGAEIKHTRWSPDEHIWLWKKARGKWSTGVHSEVAVEGKIGKLKSAKTHYQYKTVKDFFVMLNKYTENEASEKMQKGIQFSYFRMFFDPALSFFRRFIYKRGFLDGWRGFVLSYLMAVYRFTTWVKVWERENG
jgi:glycosyltransferase involved in cell wall biosynthesis